MDSATPFQRHAKTWLTSGALLAPVSLRAVLCRSLSLDVSAAFKPQVEIFNTSIR